MGLQRQCLRTGVAPSGNSEIQSSTVGSFAGEVCLQIEWPSNSGFGWLEQVGAAVMTLPFSSSTSPLFLPGDKCVISRPTRCKMKELSFSGKKSHNKGLLKAKLMNNPDLRSRFSMKSVGAEEIPLAPSSEEKDIFWRAEGVKRVVGRRKGGGTIEYPMALRLLVLDVVVVVSGVGVAFTKTELTNSGRF